MESTLYGINALVTSLTGSIYDTSTTLRRFSAIQRRLSPIFSEGSGECVHRLIDVPYRKKVKISIEIFEKVFVLNLTFMTAVP